MNNAFLKTSEVDMAWYLAAGVASSPSAGIETSIQPGSQQPARHWWAGNLPCCNRRFSSSYIRTVCESLMFLELSPHVAEGLEKYVARKHPCLSESRRKDFTCCFAYWIVSGTPSLRPPKYLCSMFRNEHVHTSLQTQ